MRWFNNKFDDKEMVAVLNSILSNICTLGCRLGAAPTVTISAASDEICPSGLVNLTAAVTTIFGTNTYQWQQLDEDDIWQNIEGATGLTYSDILTDPEEYSYRLIVTACGGQMVASNSVTVAVTSPSHVVYDSADDNEICNGGTTILHAEVVGCDDPAFQWQKKIADVWTNIAGATSIDYTTPVLTEGSYEFRVEVFCNGCGGVYSDEEIIVVVADPTVTISAEDDEICDGGISILHSEVIGGAGGNNYQWQELIDDVWTDIPGSEGADLITPALSTGEYQYRLRVTQYAGCQVISDPLIIQVVEDPIVIIATEDAEIEEGNDFTITSEVIGGAGGNTYQWQAFDYPDNPGVWSDIFGANSDTYTAVGGSVGFPLWDPLPPGEYLFRVLVIQDSGCETFSDPITITVT